MAETVKEQLTRQLEGARGALSEATNCLKRYQEEVDILTKRITDLKLAISVFNKEPPIG